LLAGLVPAFDAVWNSGTGRSVGGKLVLAGAAWALALGSRVTLLPGIACLVVITAFAAAWGRGDWRLLAARLQQDSLR
jgi:hypothetical protein